MCRDHRDCDLGNRCEKDSTASKSVTRNRCIKVLKEFDSCSDDNDCQTQLVCATAQSGKMQCLKPYSLNLGEISKDGRLCKSGAINAKGKCAQTSYITY